jgi:hypothetical protein
MTYDAYVRARNGIHDHPDDEWLRAAHSFSLRSEAAKAGLNVRAYHRLIYLTKKARPTREDAAKLTDRQILDEPNLGPVSLAAIRKWQSE